MQKDVHINVVVVVDIVKAFSKGGDAMLEGG